ncbi:MAG: HU family DNA-binding protein [Albidovulum sp.]|nr:HU family DNA-binding protein [Albidovulum sp.]MDE0305210.1 HU family DNA-binding protein [Albidovulum sp.]MDE0534153.1 HU family DNA-binding protein [Albidovulum sp.]
MALPTLKKSELVAKVAEASGLTKIDSAKALDGLCAVIRDEVVGGNAVMLPGIGKIQCRDRGERTIRNPATGDSMVKPADRAVKVTISKAFKDAANS